MISLLNFALIFAALANISLGFLVLSKNPKNKINISYFIFAFGVALWAFSAAIFQITDNLQLMHFIAIIAYYAGMLITLPFFYFTLIFPNGYSILKNYHNRILWTWGIIWFFIITFPDITIKYVSYDYGIKNLIAGPGLFFHFLSITLLMSLGVYNLAVKFLYAERKIRPQILYIFFGISIAAAIGISSNLILPLMGEHSYNWIGPIATLFFTSSMAYVIIQYHLMNISLIARIGIIYSIIFIAINIIFILSERFLGKIIMNCPQEVSSFIFPTIITIIIFIPLKNYIGKILDKTLFKNQLRPENVVKKLNSIIRHSFININELLDQFNKLIIDFIKVDNAAVLVLIPKGTLISRQMEKEEIKTLRISPDNPIINFFRHDLSQILDLNEFKNNDEKSGISAELKKLGFSIAIPLTTKNNLIGIYLVGDKKYDDPFSKEEISLLRIMAAESAFVIENARLFDEFKKIDEIKSKFIAVTSHQLRTPLTTILWNLELILKENVRSETKQELLDSAYKKAIFINEHLDDMLTAIDIEKREKEYSIQKDIADFEKIFEETLKSLAGEIKNKNIAVKIENFEDFNPFPFNIKKIKKVLFILLKNAITYSLNNGEIKISCEFKKINGKKNLVFTISDRGIGIAENEKCNIFSKFYRCEEAQKISPDGFGLGLFIVKKFIEAHGGEIWFDSTGKNNGTTFSFSLPME